MRILDNLIFRAEELGEVKIQYRLAVIYQTGDRTEENPEQARRWFERAADHGHEGAIRALARMDALEVKSSGVRTADDFSEAEELGAALPPVIDSEAKTIAVDFGHDLVSGQECPHGHGLLHDWKGNLRCWVCGWPDEPSELKKRSTARPAAAQPESATESLGRKLGFQLRGLFEKKPSARSVAGSAVESSAGEKGEAKEKGIGFDAIWVGAGIVYLLTRSCS